jgi:hypothetical protein
MAWVMAACISGMGAVVYAALATADPSVRGVRVASKSNPHAKAERPVRVQDERGGESDRLVLA